jgi:hypothetical protein
VVRQEEPAPRNKPGNSRRNIDGDVRTSPEGHGDGGRHRAQLPAAYYHNDRRTHDYVNHDDHDDRSHDHLDHDDFKHDDDHDDRS